MLFKPKEELGIVLFGTTGEPFTDPIGEVIADMNMIMTGTDNQLNDEQGGEEYANVTVLWQMDTPTLTLCDRLRALQATTDPSVKVRS